MTDSAAATAPAAAAAEVVPASTQDTAAGQETTTTAVGSGSDSVGICRERKNGSSNDNDDGCVLPKAETGEEGSSNGGNERSLEGRGGGSAAAAAAADAGQAGKKRPPRVGSVRQGRKDKRKAAWEAKKAMIKGKKKEERERREEAMRKEGREIPVDGTDYRDLPQEKWSVSQRIRHAKRLEFEALSTEGGYRVCIDMAFDELMLAKAQASLVQQVLYAYGSNRKAAQPCRMTLSGMGPVMDTKVNKLQGFDTWLGVATDSRCYTEIFDKEELVYLTADSPDTITHLEKGKVYVLGGLVDRNAHKGLCFNKATGQGIATAKLPLAKEDLGGAHSKVLATNHVFDILVRAMGAGGDLGKIEEKALPPRKRAGWTGGDDRGPSSKPVARQADPQNPEQSGQTSQKDNRNSSEEGEGGEAAGGASSSAEDRGPFNTPATLTRSGQENPEATEPDRNSPDGGARKDVGDRGDAGEAGVKGEQGVMKADGEIQGGKVEVAVGKRAVEEEDGGGSSSPGADAKRSRTKTDSGGVA